MGGELIGRGAAKTLICQKERERLNADLPAVGNHSTYEKHVTSGKELTNPNMIIFSMN